MVTLSKDRLSGTALSPAHLGDAASEALRTLVNEVADDEETLSTLRASLNEFGDAKEKWKKIAVGTGTSAEHDSGWDLPEKAVVRDAFVEVIKAEATGATKTLDVGLLSSESGGDADGLLDGIDVSTTGIKRGQATVAGGVFSANTRGVLLSDYAVGTNADDRGLYREKPHIAGGVTAKSVSYSRGSTFSEFSGYIWILYAELDGAA